MPNLFLCGFPSSGTDLLKNIVNAHEKVHIHGEVPLLPTLSRTYSSSVPSEQVSALISDLKKIDVYNLMEVPALPISGFSNQAVLFSQIYDEMTSGSDVQWTGNKTPQNTEHIPELIRLFPDARFILITRDVRDVALSWSRKWGKDKILCAAKWSRRMEMGLTFLNDYAGKVLLIKYEELLSNLEPQCRKICNFLSIDFSERMLNYHLYVEKKLEGKLNYGEKIIRNNSSKWSSQLAGKDILRIEQIAFNTINKFGYPLSSAKLHIPITKSEEIRGRLSDLAALIFVGNRAIKDKKFSYRLKTILIEIRKKLLQRRQR